MKILHIVPSLDGGGAEKFTIDLCNELGKEHEVVLCSLFDITEDMFMAKNIDVNVKVITLNKKLGFDKSVFFDIYKLIRSEKPDVVHTHLRALFYASLAVVITKIPTLHTVHNLAEKEIGKVTIKLHRFLFNHFNVHPVSIVQEVLTSVKKVYGKDKDILITNGVSIPIRTEDNHTVKKEVEAYKYNEKTQVLVNIASINDRKNQLQLVDIFNEFKKDNKNIILLLIGNAVGMHASYLEKCKEVAKDNNGIHFIGAVPNVGDYLENADALCLSSRYEGLPLVILEAMSFGVPTLATPAGGIPDVIENGINGYVSKDFKTSSLKQIIETFYEKEIKCSKKDMIERYMKNFSIEKTAQAYKNEYDKLLRKEEKR